jgi:hypothetical protein
VSGDGATGSHLLESVCKGPTHREGLGPVSQTERQAAGQESVRARDAPDVDDSTSMDLPEPIGVEFVDEVPDRHLDQELPFGGHHGSVLVFGLEVAHLFDGNDSDSLSVRALIHCRWVEGGFRSRAFARLRTSEASSAEGGCRRAICSFSRSTVFRSRGSEIGFRR